MTVAAPGALPGVAESRDTRPPNKERDDGEPDP